MTASRFTRGMSGLQLAAIVVAFFALNGVGILLYKLSKARPDVQVIADGPPSTPAAPVQVDPNLEKFRSYRGAGLAALEKGDYDKAVEQFMQALRIGRADSDILSLIKMAKELQEREPPKAAVAPKPEPEAPRAPPVIATKVTSPSRKKDSSRSRPPSRKEPVQSTEARLRVEEAPPPLTLLVTSVPSGLIIEVDGTRRDLTPAKIQVSPGEHSVSFFKGDSRLLQRNVAGEAGQVLTVDVDLSATLSPPALEGPPLVRAEPAPTPVPTPAPAAIPQPAPRLNPEPAVPTPRTGELQIISLNVHGEVFVDGQSYGYTPVVAKNLPAQQVTIEVKVDGKVRRTRTFDVVSGKRSTVKIP